jgi:hypothetical protein
MTFDQFRGETVSIFIDNFVPALMLLPGLSFDTQLYPAVWVLTYFTTLVSYQTWFGSS